MIKTSTHQLNKTKRGVASMYIVIFATLVFGIITLSFVQIILSETNQTNNSDLSRSAYDSALAGIEDGKVAVLRYHECLSQGFTANSDSDDPCVSVIQNMENNVLNGSCDTVARTLKRINLKGDAAANTGEVTVQEAGNAASNLLQAYTCVKITDILRDYRSTLGSSSRTRVVPLRTVDDDSSFTHVRFRWYSSTNHSENSNSSIYGASNTNGPQIFPIGTNNSAIVPPPMALTFIQTDTTFQFNELTASNASVSGTGTDIARLTLYPAASGASSISATEVTQSAAKNANSPTLVKCVSDLDSGYDENGDFACSVTIELPKTFQGNTSRNLGSMFMVVSLLYGEPTTDFSIELCMDDTCTAVNDEDDTDGLAYFSGVQTSIDSTGRANNLYRRIETRIELYDINFPYPEYTIQIDGSAASGASIEKGFYITKNCWYTNSPPIGGSSGNNSDTGNTCNQNNAGTAN